MDAGEAPELMQGKNARLPPRWGGVRLEEQRDEYRRLANSCSTCRADTWAPSRSALSTRCERRGNL